LISRANGLTLSLAAGDTFFGKNSAGVPFTVYNGTGIRSYAVVAGDRLTDDFEIGTDGYDIKVNGPNGFYRHFNGSYIPNLAIELRYDTRHDRPTGNIALQLKNNGNTTSTVHIKDNAYKSPDQTHTLKAGDTKTVVVQLADSHNWYDVTVTIGDDVAGFWKYAGRVETGEVGFTDPQMGYLA